MNRIKIVQKLYSKWNIDGQTRSMIILKLEKSYKYIL